MTEMSVGECIDGWPISCEYLVNGNIYDSLVRTGCQDQKILRIAAMLRAKIGQKILYEEIVEHAWYSLYNGGEFEAAERWVDEVLPLFLEHGLTEVEWEPEIGDPEKLE